MNDPAHHVTKEAVEYAYLYGQVIATDPSGTTVTLGSDASGRWFRISVSANQVILLVRPVDGPG